MSEHTLPKQHQDQQPGREAPMEPKPLYDDQDYRAGGKLKEKVALVTGGDSGIGRAVTIAYAKEGAKVAIVYLEEDEDARETQRLAAQYGPEPLLIRGDLGDQAFATDAVEKTAAHFGGLDVLVNIAGEQHPQETPEAISAEQLEKTFRTNFFSMVYLVQAALKHLPEGGAIINTSSITAYRGNPKLIDYSSTKGAITAFTRSLSTNLLERGIRVNAVAPGPIWTPLIPSTFDEEHVSQFGLETPMKRPGQPSELAAAYVYLACKDSSYVSGQTIHINGGVVING
ncbi:NAD(P)-dependent oxidoreductase [Chimaeribacter californicus]|uniref:NAD(P)-dependent oxidoreductase n=1 Tax=Chimaeribacter californicus TaxID=2060067 RepID=A0A2N5E3M0_9GAMM|nr:SDR family oxidoreductase [Chimaeribacter californicus]PLR35434.1 NAD(P)-dependent oxidoreductase [Chimaeribacter californicus]